MALMCRCNKLKSLCNIPRRCLPKSRCGITLVWLEQKYILTCDENQIRWQNLYNRCFIVYFTSVSKCLKFLRGARSHEYVILIVVSYPRETIQRIIYRLTQYSRVQNIVIACNECDLDRHFLSSIDTVHVCPTRESIFEILEKLILNVEHEYLDGGFFTTFYRAEQVFKKIQENIGMFVGTHVFKSKYFRYYSSYIDCSAFLVLLMHMPRGSFEAKQQMLHECRAYYQHDVISLAQINEFQRKYQSKDAIYWYTKTGFLFYLINKALRSQDIWAMYIFRYFIIDLSSCLEQVSKLQSFKSIRLFRGTRLNKTEFKQIEVGCLMSTNGYWSCSLYRNIAEMFICSDRKKNYSSNGYPDSRLEYALFMIDVDCRISPNTVLADVSHYSAFPDEKEVIFDFGSIFIINDITFDSNTCIWLIQVSPCSDGITIHQEYEKYINIRLQDTDPTILFGHGLINICSDLNASIVYFYQLLRALPKNHAERPNIYYNLGRTYRFMEKFDKSLECFRSARLLTRRLLPERIFDYCRFLGGMGTVYALMGDTKRALRLLTEAVMLHKKSFPDNHTEIPFHLKRLGFAYLKAKQYDQALRTLYEAENFFQTRMPVNHREYAETLYLIGITHRTLGDDTTALIYFERALCKQVSLRDKDHPTIASIYYELSIIHRDRTNYELSIDYAKKALNIQSIKLPYNHSEIKKSREILQQLQLQLSSSV